jgi:ABC-2 type transport system permease protein
MRGFPAIFQKECANFFVAPIAYAVIVIFLVIIGFIFWANVSYMSFISLQASSNPMIAEKINVTDFILRPLLQNMGFIMLFVMPLITMRLFSPVTDLAVVAGKFAASLLVSILMLASTLPSILLLFGLSQPDVGTLASGFLGLTLMAAAFLSLGLFISSLTENQIISAVVSFGAVLVFWILNWGSSIADESVGAFLKQLSILEHLDSFNKGVIALSDLSFFLLFTAFFIFMTLRSLETQRWRG